MSDTSWRVRVGTNTPRFMWWTASRSWLSRAKASRSVFLDTPSARPIASGGPVAPVTTLPAEKILCGQFRRQRAGQRRNGYLRRAAGHRVGYLMGSHDLTVIHYFTDQAVVTYLGKFVESGPPRSCSACRRGRTRMRTFGPGHQAACRFPLKEAVPA